MDRTVFFDGVCVLCNATVALLIKLDKRRKLKFAPLQGETARGLGVPNQPSPQSIIFLRGTKLSTKSEAVAQILVELGGAYKWAGTALQCVPLGLRDAVYDFVARHRYRLFGKTDVCQVPPSPIEDRFLP